MLWVSGGTEPHTYRRLSQNTTLTSKTYGFGLPKMSMLGECMHGLTLIPFFLQTLCRSLSAAP